jgi:hypothetical protein
MDDAEETDLAKKKVVKFPKKSKREAATPAAVVDDSPPTANPHVVSYLATLLERAKRGEIQAFGFAGVTPDYTAIHSFYGGTGDYRNDLVASVAYLSHSLLEESLGDEFTDDDHDFDDPAEGP